MPDLTIPTPERGQHSTLERVDFAIADESGRPSQPYRSVDILASMERRGAITAGMRQAGEDFQLAFAHAQLDPLKAADVSRPVISGGKHDEGVGMRIEAARDIVWCSILALGGMTSPAGSCLWHVMGWQRSLKEWALQRGWNGHLVSQEVASGILIAALGTLEAHQQRRNRLTNRSEPK